MSKNIRITTIHHRQEQMDLINWPEQLMIVDIPECKPAYAANKDVRLLELISSEIITSCDPRLSSDLPSSSIYRQTSSVEREQGSNIHSTESWFEEDVSDCNEVEASTLKVKIHVNPRFLPYLNVPQFSQECIGCPAILPVFESPTISIPSFKSNVVGKHSMLQLQMDASKNITLDNATKISPVIDILDHHKVDEAAGMHQNQESSSKSLFNMKCLPILDSSEIISFSGNNSFLPSIAKTEVNLDMLGSDANMLNCVLKTVKEMPWTLGCRKLSSATCQFVNNRVTNESVDQTTSEALQDGLSHISYSCSAESVNVFNTKSENHSISKTFGTRKVFWNDANSLDSRSRGLIGYEGRFSESNDHVLSLSEVDGLSRFSGENANKIRNINFSEIRTSNMLMNKQVCERQSKNSSLTTKRSQSPVECQGVTSVETSGIFELKPKSGSSKTDIAPDFNTPVNVFDNVEDCFRSKTEKPHLMKSPELNINLGSKHGTIVMNVESCKESNPFYKNNSNSSDGILHTGTAIPIFGTKFFNAPLFSVDNKISDQSNYTSLMENFITDASELKIYSKQVDNDLKESTKLDIPSQHSSSKVTEKLENEEFSEHDSQNATLELKQEIEKMEILLKQKRQAYIARKFKEKHGIAKDFECKQYAVRLSNVELLKIHGSNIHINDQIHVNDQYHLNFDSTSSSEDQTDVNKKKRQDSAMHLGGKFSEKQLGYCSELLNPKYIKSSNRDLVSIELQENMRQSTKHLQKIQLKNIVNDVKHLLKEEHKRSCENEIKDFSPYSTLEDLRLGSQVIGHHDYDEETESNSETTQQHMKICESDLLNKKVLEDTTVLPKDVLDIYCHASLNLTSEDKVLHCDPSDIVHDLEECMKLNNYSQIYISPFDMKVSNSVFNTTCKPRQKVTSIADKQVSKSKESVVGLEINSESIIQHSKDIESISQKSQNKSIERSVNSDDSIDLFNFPDLSNLEKGKDRTTEIKEDSKSKIMPFSFDDMRLRENRKFYMSRNANKLPTSLMACKNPEDKINNNQQFKNLSNYVLCSVGVEGMNTFVDELLMQENLSFFVNLCNVQASSTTNNFQNLCEVVHLNKLPFQMRVQEETFACPVVEKIHFESLCDWLSRRPLDSIQLGCCMEPFRKTSWKRSFKLVDSIVNLMRSNFLEEIKRDVFRLSRKHIFSPDDMVICLVTELKQHLDFISGNSVAMFSRSAEGSAKTSSDDTNLIDEWKINVVHQKRQTVNSFPKEAKDLATRYKKYSLSRDIVDNSIEEAVQQMTFSKCLPSKNTVMTNLRNVSEQLDVSSLESLPCFTEPVESMLYSGKEPVPEKLTKQSITCLKQNDLCYSKAPSTVYEVTDNQSESYWNPANESKGITNFRKEEKEEILIKEQSQNSDMKHDLILAENFSSAKSKRQILNNSKKFKQYKEAQNCERKLRKSRKLKNRSIKKLKKRSRGHRERIQMKKDIHSLIISTICSKKSDLQLHCSENNLIGNISLDEVECSDMNKIDTVCQKLLDCILYDTKNTQSQLLNVSPITKPFSLNQLTPRLSFFWALALAFSSLNGSMDSVIQVFCYDGIVSDIVADKQQISNSSEAQNHTKVGVLVLDKNDVNVFQSQESVKVPDNKIQDNCSYSDSFESRKDSSHGNSVLKSDVIVKMHMESKWENSNVSNMHFYKKKSMQNDVSVSHEENNARSFNHELSLIETTIQSCYCSFETKLETVIQRYNVDSIPKCTLTLNFPIKSTFLLRCSHFQSLSYVTRNFCSMCQDYNRLEENDFNECKVTSDYCHTQTSADRNVPASNESRHCTNEQQLFEISNSGETDLNCIKSASLSHSEIKTNKNDNDQRSVCVQNITTSDDFIPYGIGVVKNEGVKIQYNKISNKALKKVNLQAKSPKFMKTFRQNQLIKKKLQREGEIHHAVVQRENVSLAMVEKSETLHAPLLKQQTGDTPDCLIASSAENELSFLGTTPVSISCSIGISEGNSLNMMPPTAINSTVAVDQQNVSELDFSNIPLPRLEDEAQQKIPLQINTAELILNPGVTSPLSHIQVHNVANIYPVLGPELQNVCTSTIFQPLTEDLPNIITVSTPINLTVASFSLPSTLQEDLSAKSLNYHPVMAPQFSPAILKQFSPVIKENWIQNEDLNQTIAMQSHGIRHQVYKTWNDETSIIPRIEPPFRYFTRHTSTEHRYPLCQAKKVLYPHQAILKQPMHTNPDMGYPKDFIPFYPASATTSIADVCKRQFAVASDSHLAEPMKDSSAGMNSRIYIFKQDNAICASIQNYLLLHVGLRLFDPNNIIALRAVPNIDCLVLVCQSDISYIHHIPNLLRLKRDLRVKFLLYESFADIKLKKFQIFFPKGGLVVIDNAALFDCNPDTIRCVCEFMSKQSRNKEKPWVLFVAANALQLLKQCRNRCTQDENQALRLECIIEILEKFKESNVVKLLPKLSGTVLPNHQLFDEEPVSYDGDHRLCFPKSTLDYQACCLNMQHTFMTLHRHFIFVTDMSRMHTDAQLFLESGIDVMNISEFMKNFLSLPSTDHHPRFNQFYSTRLSPLCYTDARLSDAIDAVSK